MSRRLREAELRGFTVGVVYVALIGTSVYGARAEGLAFAAGALLMAVALACWWVFRE